MVDKYGLWWIAPAIAWLCSEFLPTLPQWPKGLDPQGSFAISLTAEGLAFRPTTVPVPEATIAIGACTSEQGGPELLFACETHGRERWFVPADLQVPARWLRLLRAIEGDLLGAPRTLALPVITGHLAGGMADRDPTAALLRLCPALCGDVTWMAFARGEELEVCGQSGGGLMLPLALLAIAMEAGAGEPSPLSLRAFAARDPDQTEAARQLGRSDRDVDLDTLRSLLRAEDPVRLTAIESLVRHGQTDELVNIIASASNDKPWATIAARDAVLRLWPATSDDQREEVRAALLQSETPLLRELAVSGLPSEMAPVVRTPIDSDQGALTDTISVRARTLIVLFLIAVGVFGFWARERAHFGTTTS